MVTGEVGAFQEQHVPALACQHGGSRAAAWSAANNHHIGTEIRSTQRCHPPISLCVPGSSHRPGWWFE